MPSIGNSESTLKPEIYADWVGEHFPLLASDRHTDVVREMERLVELACSTAEESLTARELLGYMIVSRGGAPEGTEQHYVAHVAARTLMRLSYDSELRESVFSSVCLALTSCLMLPPDMRLIMLDAFEAFAHDKHWRDDHLKEMADVLLKSLRTEFERLVSDRDERYQLRLLFLMKLAGSAEAEPLFDAIADYHDSAEVQALAKKVSRHVLDSMEYMWANTPEDQVSSEENRAARMCEAPDLKLSEGESVQVLFSQMKGASILIEADPRLVPLETLMRSGTERMRLAAAFALGLCLKTEEAFAVARLAIKILAGFAVNCERPSDLNDSLFALKKVRGLSAGISQEVDRAKQAASEDFINRSLQ
jgi:hypothetical protein